MFDSEIHPLAYRLVAFRTAKGTFTLNATDKDWNDTFRNINTNEYHTWNRKTIKSWYEQGKIQPVPTATTLDWQTKAKTRPTIKRNRKKV